MPSSQLIHREGRLAKSPFSTSDVHTDSGGGGSRHASVVLLGAVAVFGVGFLMVMRAREGTYQTGSALTLYPGASPDQSSIDNLTQSILNLQQSGFFHTPAASPGGGVSSPIDTSTSVVPPSIGVNGQPILPTPQMGTAGIPQGMANAQALAQYYSDAYNAVSAYAKANPGATSVNYNGTNWSTDPQSLANMKATSQSIVTNTNKDAAAWGVAPISVT